MEFIQVITLLAVLVLIFLVFREFVTWYWKINENILLQKEIIVELKKLNNSRKGEPITRNLSDLLPK